MRRVAITGSLATGKSTVLRFFEELGAYVVSADTLVHQAFSSNSTLKKRLKNLLGNDVLVRGSLDRKKIAERIFENKHLLEKVEEICHKIVFKTIKRLYLQAQYQGEFPLFVVEVPLLFESKVESKVPFCTWFHDSVLVLANEDDMAKRFKALGGDEKQYEKRLHRQMPQCEKKLHADYVLENTGSLLALKKQTKALFLKLSSD